MAQINRSKPTLSEAMAALTRQPAMTIADYCELAKVNRMTALKAANAGELEGAFRVGRQFRVATPPWRQRLGIPAAPELAKFGVVSAETVIPQHEAA